MGLLSREGEAPDHIAWVLQRSQSRVEAESMGLPVPRTFKWIPKRGVGAEPHSCLLFVKRHRRRSGFVQVRKVKL